MSTPFASRPESLMRDGPGAADPLISIIMPVHQGDAVIDRALSSLLNQMFSDWELRAVDDGSTDGSYERLLGWSGRDPRIKVSRTEANRGPGAARNEAIRQARGEMLVYLDCDDEFYPDYLEQVARLHERADVLIFGYDYLTDGDDPSRARPWIPTPHRQHFFEANLSTPLGVAHRRELWSRVGGFDETLWCQEDWEFWKRLARTGAEILFIPLRSGLYRFRQDSRSQSPRITPDQHATYEASRSAGGVLYGSSTRPAGRRPVQKVLFAAPYSYFDPGNQISETARDLLELLARFGFACQAFCGMGSSDSDNGESEQILDQLGLPHQVRDAVHGLYAARLLFTRKDGVPVTLVHPRPTRSEDPWSEIIASFLAFFERFLEANEPDVLVTHSDHPSHDPMIRLAKRRDIPIVIPLLETPRRDRMAFYNVDYCLVTSEASRRRYWEEFGLSCIALPPICDPSDAGPVYANFFRNIYPQPGPPFVPERSNV